MMEGYLRAARDHGGWMGKRPVARAVTFISAIGPASISASMS